MTKSLKIILFMVLLIEASLICDAQSFCNQSNILVGKIESGGIVRDKKNMTIGKVESDGTVRDKNNMTIGYAKDIPKTYAAVFFLFKLFEK